MKYDDIKNKHNLTAEQWAYLQQLCQLGAVDTETLQDWTDGMTIIGKSFNGGLFIHVRHTDIVLHMDLYDASGDCKRGASWALTPEGEQYAVRGVQL